jgi:hypothetical protein
MLRLASTLVSLASEYAVNPADREVFGAILISRTVAFSLALPSSPVTNPQYFYDAGHSDTVNSVLSKINEVQVIPVAMVQDQIRKVWLARYRMVYEPTCSEAFELASCILNHEPSVYAESTLAYIASVDAKRKFSYAFRELLDVYNSEIGVTAAVVPEPLSPEQTEAAVAEVVEEGQVV